MRAAIAALAVFAVTLAGSNATAQERAGNGVELDIGVVDRTFPFAGQLNLTVPARIGFRVDRLAIMLGIYGIRGSIGEAGENFLGEETSTTMSGLALNLAPTVRFYLSDLEAGKLVPYVQGEFNYVITTTSTEREPAPPTPPGEDSTDETVLGFAVSAGGEYLVSKNFGLSGDLALRMLYVGLSQDDSESSASATVLALGATLSANFHF
jgi:opacity protein-like surface antigen